MKKKMMEECAKMMEHGGHSGHGTKVAAAGIAGGLLRPLMRHPLVIFSLGAAAGYLGFKYRKEIAGGISKATDAGKDFVLEQKEKLSDILAEAKEAEEEEGKKKAAGTKKKK